ncbi:MAG: hypothetical protein E6689_11350 [Corynebacterium striatum]|uniref:hypothetical protein n=1 Tax=Corynebacterium sp. c25Ua_89 TaxID=3032356 RepID=UPI0029027C14|nr:hypothetical protein [Corynebacterium striatum]
MTPLTGFNWHFAGYLAMAIIFMDQTWSANAVGLAVVVVVGIALFLLSGLTRKPGTIERGGKPVKVVETVPPAA